MSPEERTTPPAAVRDTAYILLLVAGYCGVASGVLSDLALQSGWAMTIAAIAHAILAVAFWIVRGGVAETVDMGRIGWRCGLQVLRLSPSARSAHS